MHITQSVCYCLKNHTLSQRRWRPSQQNSHNLIQHLSVGFWTLGHSPHWPFHTSEFSSLLPTAQRKEEELGTVVPAPGAISTAVRSSIPSEWRMSPHRSPLRLQVHSKPESLKQKMGTCVGQATLTVDTDWIQHKQRKLWVPMEFWGLLH